MAAVGSGDGREIVLELEDLRAKAALDRDADGRYLLQGKMTFGTSGRNVMAASLKRAPLQLALAAGRH